MATLTVRGVVDRMAGFLCYRHPEPFREKFGKKWFWLMFVCVFGLTYAIGHSRPARIVGLAVWDALQELNTPKPAEVTRVIVIDDRDYEVFFRRRSPLDASALSKVVDVLRGLGPAVIGVDIDTSDESFAGQLPVGEPPIPIVWARRSEVVDGTVGGVGAVLGDPTSEPPWTGVAMWPRDEDWRIRRASRRFRFGSRSLDSFNHAIVRALCEKRTLPVCENGWSDTDRAESLGFLPMRAHRGSEPIPLREVMNANVDKTFFANRAVILGGTYAESDKYPVATREIDGVELVAQAVETEASQGFVTPAEWVGVPLKVLLGLFVAYFHLRLKPVAALAATVLLGCIVTAVMVVGFTWGAIWLDVVPFLFALTIEQIVEGAEKAHHLAG